MDNETALAIGEDCADGNGYLYPMEELKQALTRLRLIRGSFYDGAQAIEWELHIRSVSPARIDA